MQPDEQQLIDGLFNRLKDAEKQSAPRDESAEQHIAQRLESQPGAPYYMAQTILIQEAAIKRINGHIQALQGEIARLQHQNRQQSSSGFLSGLFGESHTTPPSPASASTIPTGNSAAAPLQPGSSFLSGALQTAAGVAGGVVLGNMLTDLFSHTRPEELLNIINEPAQPADNSAINSVEDYNQADDSQFLNQDAGLVQENPNDVIDTSADNSNTNSDDDWI